MKDQCREAGRRTPITAAMHPSSAAVIVTDDAPRECLRFDRCSASLCPLDLAWRTRRHIRGDEVCFYLTESVKQDAAANFMPLGLGWLLEVLEPLADDAALPSDIKNALRKARRTGSRIASQQRGAERLRAWRQTSNKGGA